MFCATTGQVLPELALDESRNRAFPFLLFPDPTLNPPAASLLRVFVRHHWPARQSLETPIGGDVARSQKMIGFIDGTDILGMRNS
jgi:hypothetical protein